LDTILDGLTEPQLQAVTCIKGPLLVIAGAGSGKTRVIIKRISNMINQGIDPRNILGITFTNKAAGEMVERISQEVIGGKPLISTFHSFCARVLRAKASYAGLDSNFVIYDTSDMKAAYKMVVSELGLDSKTYDTGKVSYYISDAKNRMISPSEMEQHARDEFSKSICKIYRRYQSFLQESNAADFDDLLLLVVKIFAENKEVLEEYQQRYQYLLVDEYQDTNLPQHELVKLLSSKHGNLCVTGDPDQTIYSWRGANIGNINGFMDEHPNAVKVSLLQNFRSTNFILRAANAVIAHNYHHFDKKLYSELGDGEKLKFKTLQNELSEADFIIENIVRLKDQGVLLKEIAVFYRTNGQTRVIEDALRLENIPYTIVGGTKFYDRKEIKDLISYLRLIVNGRDNVSLMRVLNTPSRGIGNKTIQNIREYAEHKQMCMAEALTQPDLQNLLSSKAKKGVQSFLKIFSAVYDLGEKPKVSEALEKIYEFSGYKVFLDADKEKGEDRKSNIEALINAAVDHQEKVEVATISSFLENVALMSDLDSWEDKEDKVTLMTLHSAKGLEFEAVFISGVEEGLLPHKNSMDTDEDVEEERRLCYVGITRAKRILFMTTAQSRLQWGQRIYTRNSRFYGEIPIELIDNLGGGGYQSSGGGTSSGFSLMNSWSNKKEEIETEIEEEFFEDDFEEEITPEAITVVQGDIVNHPKFGKGVVMRVTGDDENAKIKVIFESHGEKELMAAYANLSKLN